MSNFTAEDVKNLRAETGAGMLAVKNALTEADGDHDKALEIIRLSGQKSVSKRGDRVASAGLVTARVVENDTVGVIVEVNSETDFVAKTPRFVEFSAQVLEAAIASGAASVEELLAAPAAEGTVSDSLAEIGAVIGEKIEIRRLARIAGEHVDVYLHQTSPDLPAQVGVLVATDAAAAGLAHDIGMHIAVYAPDYLDRDHVPADVLAKERATLEKLTIQEGKPEHIVPKIVEGRINAFYKDNCLVDQSYVRDEHKSVGQVLTEAGGSVTDFVRFHVGA